VGWGIGGRGFCVGWNFSLLRGELRGFDEEALVRVFRRRAAGHPRTVFSSGSHL